jgi:hypothetical protein
VAEASQMLSEHQAPDRDAGKSAEQYTPSPEERKAIQLVEDTLSKNKKHRRMYDHEWLDYYRMFRGRQWKEQRPSYRHSEVLNFIFRSIQSTVPIQVDARPRFEYLPQEPGDVELAEIINEVAEADWIRNNWGEQLLEVVYDANIYGTGMSEMEGAPNRINYESRDPVYCFPAPEARDTNRNCPNFVYAEPKDIGWVKRKWPDKAKFLKPDVAQLVTNERTQNDVRFRSPADRNMVMEGSTPTDPANKDLVLFKVLYLSPESCAEATGEPRVREDGSPEREYIQKAKYPNGRRIITCSGVLLEDGPIPYDDAQIPFDRYVNYLMPREFWGMSEVEQLKGPQRVINKVFSFVLDVMTLMGNPIWMVPTSSGVDPDSLTNRPGLNVEFDGDNPPQRVEGVQLQPYVLQVFDKISQIFDSISGSEDVTRGVQPSGVTAASAISSLQEAAHTRIRQKARNLDFYLQGVGQKYLSRLFQFMTAPQVYRLTGKDGAQRYFRMQVEPVDRTLEDGKTVVPGTKVKVTPYTDDGKEDVTGMREFEVRGKFDVRVVTGSSLPFARAEKEGKLQKLFELGIIDEEEVLKGSDYPNWEAVLQRIQKKKAAEAQAAAAAQPPPKGAA